jgi:hypothetical protein
MKKEAYENTTLSANVDIRLSISIKTPVGTKFDKKFKPINVAKILFILSQNDTNFLPGNKFLR